MLEGEGRMRGYQLQSLVVKERQGKCKTWNGLIGGLVSRAGSLPPVRASVALFVGVLPDVRAGTVRV